MFYFLSFLPFIFTLFLEFKFKSPFIIFTIAIGGLYFISSLIISEKYPDWVGFEVDCLAFIFFVSYFFGRFFSYRLLNVNANKKLDLIEFKRIKKITGIVLFLALIFSMSTFDFNFDKMLYSNWADYRMESSKLELLVLYLYMCGSSYLCFSILDKDKKGILFSIFVLLYFIIVLKSRGYIISMVVPLVIYWINYTKINLAKVFYIFFSVFLVSFLYVLTRYIRWAGSVDSVDLSNFNLSDLFGDDLGEFQLLDVFYEIIFFNNIDTLGIDFLTSIKRIIFFPVSQFYNISPKDISYIIWDYHVGISGVNGSYHTTVISESYLNDKYVGIFIFPIFIAVIFTIFDKILCRNPNSVLMLSGVICYASMAIARGSSYNGFLVLIICTFFMIFINRIFLKCKF